MEKRNDDPRYAIEVLHDARDLLTAQDDGYANWHASARHILDSPHLNMEYVAIEKQDRAKRLVLRRRTDSTLRREPREERGDF